MSLKEPDDKTHFGYEHVTHKEKTRRVEQVFNSVATHYDVMNDLMSLGLHRIWKRFSIELASIRPTHSVLDIAAGTGDLALRIAPLLNQLGQLFVTDINGEMLTIARDRLIEKGLINNVHFIRMDAESIPFPDNLFDVVTIGFGLRNFSHKEFALKAIHRVLKPGGKLIILEFSHPTSNLLTKLYDLYSFNLLPLLGKFIAKDDRSYQYLAESIRMHPNQSALCNMLSEAGFSNCDYHNLSGGIVAIHRGYKI